MYVIKIEREKLSQKMRKMLGTSSFGIKFMDKLTCYSVINCHEECGLQCYCCACPKVR